MKLSKQSRLQLNIQRFIFLLLFISSIGMLAWISDHYSYQFDLTANRRHSLSESSIELLGKLDKTISVHAYTTDDVSKQAIRDIIRRYQNIKPGFTLRILNPDIDLAEAKQDGIVMDKPFAFVIYYNDHMEPISSLSEQAISNALLRLNRRDNQQVVFLSGHGERDIDGTDKRAYAVLKRELEAKGFNLQSINMLEQPVPENTQVLVIAAPDHPYLQGELDQINEFIDHGGNLMWLVDPGELQGLDKLATSLGLQLQDGVIVDNDPELRRTLNIHHPAIIPVTKYFPHIITDAIRYNTLFPLARGISPLDESKTVNHWQAYALFNSGDQSWTETNGISDEMVFSSSTGDVAGPITISVILLRPYPTEKTITGPGPEDNPERQQRVVVIGDSDFMADSYIGAGANLELGINMFSWLLGDNDFISVIPQSSPDTRLELSDNQLMIISFGFFLVIPLGLIFTGFRIWHIRKNR
ncbi:MAG: GldG family protein [Proteobacteria bacterium]|nr:GldG family protein [Pseudomonadota bacterium]